jgi:hypothetical protein
MAVIASAGLFVLQRWPSSSIRLGLCFFALAVAVLYPPALRARVLDRPRGIRCPRGGARWG